MLRIKPEILTFGIAGFQTQKVRGVEFIIVEIVGQVFARGYRAPPPQRIGTIAVINAVNLTQQGAFGISNNGNVIHKATIVICYVTVFNKGVWIFGERP